MHNAPSTIALHYWRESEGTTSVSSDSCLIEPVPQSEPPDNVFAFGFNALAKIDKMATITL